MVVYPIYLNIAAILILASLVISHRANKSLPIYENKVFTVFMYSIIVNSFVSILVHTFEYGIFPNVLLVLHFLNLTNIVISLSILVIYIALIVNVRIHLKNIVKLLCAPFSSLFAIVFINMKTGLFFSVNSAGTYITGPYMKYTYLFYIYFLIAFFIIVYKNKKALTRNHMIIIPALIFVAFTGLTIDFLFPKALSMQFSFSIFATLLFFCMKNPNEYYSDDSLMMNKAAFFSICESRILSDNPVEFVAMNIHDIDLINSQSSKEQIFHAEATFNKYLRQVSKKLLTFKIAAGQYLVVMDEYNPKEFGLVYKEVCRIMNFMETSSGITYPVLSTCCAFSSPNDVSSIRMIENLFAALKKFDSKNYKPTVTPMELQLQSDTEIMRIEELVKNSIENNRLEVYYQPIYNAEEKSYTSAEALIRMRDDKGKFISPEVFIPIAEKSSLIIDIGRFVLSEVCSTISSEHLSDYGLDYIEVNLSMVECLQSNLASNVMSILKKYRVFPSQINLELTETSSSEFNEIVDINIKTLTEKNIHFSIDDFGTGYSSLIRILSLPLKLIKIDKSLVQAPYLTGDEKSMILLESFTKTAYSTGAELVAEGVETAEMARGVIALGCKYLQGYYFSKPLNREDYVKLMHVNTPPAI